MFSNDEQQFVQLILGVSDILPCWKIMNYGVEMFILWLNYGFCMIEDLMPAEWNK